LLHHWSISKQVQLNRWLSKQSIYFHWQISFLLRVLLTTLHLIIYYLLLAVVLFRYSFFFSSSNVLALKQVSLLLLRIHFLNWPLLLCKDVLRLTYFLPSYVLLIDYHPIWFTFHCFYAKIFWINVELIPDY
jgi:hypothetical protein